jgi:hypothetical protein
MQNRHANLYQVAKDVKSTEIKGRYHGEVDDHRMRRLFLTTHTL